MFNHARKLIRWGIAALLVAIPSSYLLWQWAYVGDPVLPGMSFSAFNEKLSSAEEPPFWTYVIWILLVFALMTLVTNLLAGILERVFPDARKEGKEC